MGLEGLTPTSDVPNLQLVREHDCSQGGLNDCASFDARVRPPQIYPDGQSPTPRSHALELHITQRQTARSDLLDRWGGRHANTHQNRVRFGGRHAGFYSGVTTAVAERIDSGSGLDRPNGPAGHGNVAIGIRRIVQGTYVSLTAAPSGPTAWQ